MTDSIGIYPTIRACGGAGYQQGYLLDRRGNNLGDEILYAVATQQGGAEITDGRICPTVTSAAGMSGNNQPYVVIRVKGEEHGELRSERELH